MEKDDITIYAENGMSAYAISKEIGRSSTYVLYRLSEYGLEPTNNANRIILCYRCSECKTEDINKFKPGLKTACKKCFNKWQNTRSRQTKIDSVEYKGGACMGCGYNKSLAALCFHHRDPNEKDPNWDSLSKKYFYQIIEELDKCDLLCFNCHAEIHEQWRLEAEDAAEALEELEKITTKSIEKEIKSIGV